MDGSLSGPLPSARTSAVNDHWLVSMRQRLRVFIPSSVQQLVAKEDVARQTEALGALAQIGADFRGRGEKWRLQLGLGAKEKE